MAVVIEEMTGRATTQVAAVMTAAAEAIRIADPEAIAHLQRAAVMTAMGAGTDETAPSWITPGP